MFRTQETPGAHRRSEGPCGKTVPQTSMTRNAWTIGRRGAATRRVAEKQHREAAEQDRGRVLWTLTETEHRGTAEEKRKDVNLDGARAFQERKKVNAKRMMNSETV